MKKILVGFLCAATMMSAAVPAFAAKANNVVVSPNPTAVVTQKSPAVQYNLKINDKNVDLGSLKIVEMKDRFMVPLRITSEALGFTVTYDVKNNAIHMDDGNMQTDLTLGKDNYFAYSSKAIGMTAPQSLGVAPTTIEGSTYVPVDFYKILLTDPNCVSIKDSVVSISAGSAKPDKAPDSIGMPCPLVNYNTLDEARKAVEFTFAVPATLPDGYKTGDIIVISNELAEIFYRNGDKEILYRTAKGNADISGDYNVYDIVKTITIGNTEVTVKGKGDSINLATWTKDGVSFSLSFDEAVNEKTLSAIIESISSDSTKADKASEIPCPLVNYNTLDEARKAVGFTFAVPATLPDGYKTGDIIVISNELAEIFYRNGDKEILYRTAKGNADISGDGNVYDKVNTITVGNTEVTVKTFKR